MSDVHVSEELFAPVGGGVELCYQTFGDPSADPLLLVMGLGGPMIWWDDEFCKLLAGKGFHVIRYDNRDTGKSSHVRGRVRRPDLVRAFLTGRGAAPYGISDMASDGVGLLDHLAIDSAHVVGISMGGMIVQTMALDHPGRVRSLTSIMSTTGKRSVGWQDPKLLPRLLAGKQVDRQAYVDTSVAFAKLIGSPSYPEPTERATKRAEDTFDRGLNGPGVLRHMMAVLTQPNRSKALHSLTIPSQVIHGLRDRMVHVSGGRATSAAIPGSELLLVDGMGHDLPPELWESVTDAIRRTADRGNI
ncbi:MULTISPECIES: alpha/beta fold hydrolase [unclassified Nocardioides]|uniref:alpha/beta fold hydrolase n=1 Tax=unclassified Nocardioides TaxID=2615069 RepID=UPI0006F39C3B|nr:MULTISPECIES: alpha/beta hydrolase [unclassified Nocardioides]KQY56358.1 alpha/beta hydrolase [Nocardioides sp. Root140]KRF14221.1 alpha/beta hydrolase [Nocardioides sp. Soil796]